MPCLFVSFSFYIVLNMYPIDCCVVVKAIKMTENYLFTSNAIECPMDRLQMPSYDITN